VGRPAFDEVHADTFELAVDRAVIRADDAKPTGDLLESEPVALPPVVMCHVAITVCFDEPKSGVPVRDGQAEE